jgi:hypothetical protein
VFRETVQAQGEAIACARGRDLERNSVRGDANELYVFPIHISLEPKTFDTSQTPFSALGGSSHF